MNRKFSAIIATISFTGKVGKSSITNNLLYPRMENAQIFRIETMNESGLSGSLDNEHKLKGRDIEKLITGLSKTDCAIVDIGSSNVESFVLGLTQQSDSHRIFDFFVVPVEANGSKVNEFKEAVKTLTMLNKLGVEPDRIKVVFNKLSPDCEIEDEMHRLFNYHKKCPIFSINHRAVIHETQAFKALADAKKSYEDVLSDTTDYWKIFKETALAEVAERTRLVKMDRTQGLVRGLNSELDSVFNALFGKSSKVASPIARDVELDASMFD